jgi:hypothetical protein
MLEAVCAFSRDRDCCWSLKCSLEVDFVATICSLPKPETSSKCFMVLLYLGKIVPSFLRKRK